MTQHEAIRPSIDTRNLPDLGEMKARAIAGVAAFQGDVGLVHGHITQDVSTVEAVTGAYNHRTPNFEQLTSEELASIRFVLVQCMDRRTSKELEEMARACGFEGKEVMRIYVGGGAVQGGDRVTSLRDLVAYVGQVCPNVEEVEFSAHTRDPRVEGSSPCGGVKYCCGQQPLLDAMSEKALGVVNRAYESFHPDAEVRATAALLRGAVDDLAPLFSENVRIRAGVAVPDEEAGSVDYRMLDLNKGTLAMTLSELTAKEVPADTVVPRRLV